MTEHVIDRLGLHGDGVAAGPVYVPGALPGERVSCAADGSDVRILEPSPDRVKPPCRHAKACGGCVVQHASEGFVAQWKMNVIRHALAAHGLEAEIRPILTSAPNSRRRATFTAKRTKKGAMAGFHARGSDIVIETPDCQLLLPQVQAAREMAAELAVIGASRKAPLAVQVTASEVGLDVVARGGKPLDGPLRQVLAAFCAENGLARLSWGDEIVAMANPPVQRFGNALVCPPPGAFLQATAQGEADLLLAVQEALTGTNRIADLFAGCGTFALPLAETAMVHAVEGEADMLHALDKGWRMAQGLKTITHEPRDLFRRPLLPDELKRFDGIVIDPPRAGAEAQVAEIAKSDIDLIAYVSCNPVSFARDLAILTKSGFDLDWVQPVDQFRWAAHTELAARLVRR